MHVYAAEAKASYEKHTPEVGTLFGIDNGWPRVNNYGRTPTDARQIPRNLTGTTCHIQHTYPRAEPWQREHLNQPLYEDGRTVIV